MTTFKQIDFNTTADFSNQNESLYTYIRNGATFKNYTISTFVGPSNFGNVDYTIEFQYRVDNDPRMPQYIQQFPSGGIGIDNKFWIDMWDDGYPYLQIGNNGVNNTNNGYVSSTQPNSIGVHNAKISFKNEYSNGPITVRLYVDGIEPQYNSWVDNAQNPPRFTNTEFPDNFYISLDGYIDSIKIYDNIAGKFWGQLIGCTQS